MKLLQRHHPLAVTTVGTLLAITGTIAVAFLVRLFCPVSPDAQGTFLFLAVLCPLLVAPGLLGALSYTIARSEQRYRELKRLNDELVLAFAVVRARRELVTQCAWCRRVGDEAGQWHPAPPDAGQRVSHGICPACQAVHFPDDRD